MLVYQRVTQMHIQRYPKNATAVNQRWWSNVRREPPFSLRKITLAEASPGSSDAISRVPPGPQKRICLIVFQHQSDLAIKKSSKWGSKKLDHTHLHVFAKLTLDKLMTHDIHCYFPDPGRTLFTKDKQLPFHKLPPTPCLARCGRRRLCHCARDLQHAGWNDSLIWDDLVMIHFYDVLCPNMSKCWNDICKYM